MESLAARGIHIEMILDDDDAFWGTKIFNTIIKSPRDVVKPSIDCVVLSSDAMEQRLWDKAQALREQGIAVIRLYDPKRKRS